MVFRYAFFYIPSDEITLPNSTRDLPHQGNHAIVGEAGAYYGQQENYPLFYPKQLRIPSIKVNSKIRYVGITRQGNMATPSNFTDVGWFKYGPLPGEKGSAIIAGHVNNGINLPGVFGHLDNINIGDNIYVDTLGGDHIHYVVTNVEIYDFNAPTDVIFNQDNGNFLKLITCAGVWVNEYKTHDKRLVVTAQQQA